MKIAKQVSKDWYTFILKEKIFFIDPSYNSIYQIDNTTTIKEELVLSFSDFKEIINILDSGTYRKQDQILYLETKYATRTYVQSPKKILEDLSAIIKMLPLKSSSSLNLKEVEQLEEIKKELVILKTKPISELLILIEDDKLTIESRKQIFYNFKIELKLKTNDLTYRGSFNIDGSILKVLGDTILIYEPVITDYVCWLILKVDESLLYLKIKEGTRKTKIFNDFNPLSFLEL